MTGFLKSEHLVVSETRVGKSFKKVNPGYHHKRKESSSRVLILFLTSNEKILKMYKGRDREKVKKQDGMSTIMVNYKC